MRHLNTWLCIPVMLACALATGAAAQEPCSAGTLWEPYSEVCAPVRDARDEFIGAADKTTAVHTDAPVPGTMTAGTAYAPEQLPALASGRLHTRMFVYPDGLERDGPLPAWLYTTATSRVDDGLEVVAMYREDSDTGHLGLFAWPCLADFPCPNGATFPAWQWSRPLTEFTCNITHAVDQGGHAQKVLYYANHSDRIDSGSPPLWRSAVYLWNYCDAAWDLAWRHEYRQDKTDCSVPGAGCAWWGPSIEIFGEAVYPQVGELGYEDSLLYHDGRWSLLQPPETQFRDPADPRWGSLTPWQMFHLEANRSYGLGNWFDVNDAPVIEGQDGLATEQGQPLALDTSVLEISDADVDPAYHVDYELTVYPGSDYTWSDGELTPDAGFTGTLTVPVTVSDGAAESETFDLVVQVGPYDGDPVILAQAPIETLEDYPVIIEIDDLVVEWPGHDVGALTVILHAGPDYAVAGTTIVPVADFFGTLEVPVTVSDGVVESGVFELDIAVIAVNDPPVINGQRTLETLERTPVDITIGDVQVSDPDNGLSDLSLHVLDGTGYERSGNTVTPDQGVTGTLTVGVIASDGALESPVYELSIRVLADDVPPEIRLLGGGTITVPVGSTYADAGATATDNVDGDISDRIVVQNPVDTSRAGTYTVTYRVEDLAGNVALASRTVIVAAAAPSSSGGGGGAVSLWLLAVLSGVALWSRRSVACGG